MWGKSHVQTVKRLLPADADVALRRARNRVQGIRHRGTAVECPACGRGFARFLPRLTRRGAICPGCWSLERHRMFWLFIKARPELLSSGTRLLHIAPEGQIERHLRSRPGLDYVTADLLRKDVDLRLDVTAIDLPDESFDAVICSHVFEHVDDDRLAMRELRRIIRPGGWAILTAPVDPSRGDTFEDWSITTPEARKTAFGQWDHVRLYGRTYPDLLRGEGWEVTPRPMPLGAEDAERYGIPAHEQDIYFARPV